MQQLLSKNWRNTESAYVGLRVHQPPRSNNPTVLACLASPSVLAAVAESLGYLHALAACNQPGLPMLLALPAYSRLTQLGMSASCQAAHLTYIMLLVCMICCTWQCRTKCGLFLAYCAAFGSIAAAVVILLIIRQEGGDLTIGVVSVKAAASGYTQ